MDRKSEKAVASSVDELRGLIRKGMESGPGKPAEEAIRRLEAKYRRMAEKTVEG